MKLARFAVPSHQRTVKLTGPSSIYFSLGMMKDIAPPIVDEIECSRQEALVALPTDRPTEHTSPAYRKRR